MTRDVTRGLPRRAVLGGGLAAMALRSMPALGAGVAAIEEKAIEPDLPIVDCHHHLFDWRTPQPGRSRYILPDLMRDIAGSGHRVTDTVFVECSTMYRADGPAEERSLGETDYIRAVAAESATGRYGACRVASAMVGKVDLSIGDRAQSVLERHIEASGGLFRGVRNSIAWDDYAPLKTMGLRRDLLSDSGFRAGAAALSAMNLSLDIWLFHPQIPQLTALARALPGMRIILNHLGSPLGIGPYTDRAQIFADWKAAMVELARSGNVAVKLGGLGPFSGAGPSRADATSRKLAQQWRPYIETAIACFGPDRCMFESNWPANASVSSYGMIWNAFKRITAGYSDGEKAALYGGTARNSYRIAAAPVAKQGLGTD